MNQSKFLIHKYIDDKLKEFKFIYDSDYSRFWLSAFSSKCVDNKIDLDEIKQSINEALVFCELKKELSVSSFIFVLKSSVKIRKLPFMKDIEKEALDLYDYSIQHKVA